MAGDVQIDCSPTGARGAQKRSSRVGLGHRQCSVAAAPRHCALRVRLDADIAPLIGQRCNYRRDDIVAKSVFKIYK